MSDRTRMSEYTSWRAMKMRCLQKNSSQYKYYGARGITICREWIESFDAFLADMGPKPSLEHTIDRVNNDGNYEPTNCRWAHKREQSKNSRNTRWVTSGEVTDSVAGWSRRLGVSAKFLRQRLSRGWTIERALSEPAFNRGQK